MHISSLSFNDTIEIIAHFHNTIVNEKKIGLKDRGFTELQLKEMQRTGNFKPLETCGLRIKDDISSIKYEHFDYVCELLQSYELGHLPFPGSASEQPAQIMQILSLLKYLQYEHKQRLDKEASKSKPKNQRHK